MQILNQIINKDSLESIKSYLEAHILKGESSIQIFLTQQEDLICVNYMINYRDF